MSSVSGDVPIECPNCHNEIFKPFAWVAENDRFECPVCAKTVCFDAREFVRQSRQERRELNQFSKWLDGLQYVRAPKRTS